MFIGAGLPEGARPWAPALRREPFELDLFRRLAASAGVSGGEQERSVAEPGGMRARHTGADFLRFLKTLNRRYQGRELHVVLDNSSTHSTPELRAWLEAHPNVWFHFTPAGASWLNTIEAWFGILTRKSVRRGSFGSVKDLVQHIRHYIEHRNEHPTPFVWTRKPADIIRKAIRRSR